MYEIPDLNLDGLSCVYCYCIFNCDGKDLVYIGQTNNLQSRHKKHIPLNGYGELKVDKYLKTHMWSLDILWIGFREDANAMEKFFIKLFDSVDNGLNLTDGGGVYKPSVETLKKHSELKIGTLNPNHKAVYQYDKDGSFIRKWDAVSIASRTCGINKDSISNCANNLSKTAGGFVWRYDFIPSVTPVSYSYSKTKCKKVIQYDLDINIVAEWDSVNLASRTLGIDCGAISRAARGIFNQCRGYIWRYAG